ncbi:MAG: cobalamin biosynthesis central domain-containing protein, partial [Cyanobacteria bacterium P01_G01_bin.49]
MSNDLFDAFQPIGAIATTPQGTELLTPLCQQVGATLYIPASFPLSDAITRHYQGSLKAHLENIWGKNRALVFCLATGAVVRLIAPLLEDKASDPAIIVIDPKGEFVISLCSGHQGGADCLSQLIADQLNATPIITGASTSLNIPGIDILGLPFGWRKGPGNWTEVSHAIACQKTVQVIQEGGSSLWQNHLPDNHHFDFGLPEIEKNISPTAGIWISPIKQRLTQASDIPWVQWYPRVLWVGIGCIRGTSQGLINYAINEVCQEHHLVHIDYAEMEINLDLT